MIKFLILVSIFILLVNLENLTDFPTERLYRMRHQCELLRVKPVSQQYLCKLVTQELYYREVEKHIAIHRASWTI
jgi:hypothetical protein